MHRRLKIFTVLLFTAWPLGCGPKGQGSRATQTHQTSQDAPASADTDAEKLVAAPLPKKPPENPPEPNVPFAMSGGGPRHLHRASVPGPRTLPEETARFNCGGRIAASPVIGPDGTVYIGSVDGTFNALSGDGKLRWSYVCDEPIFSTAAVSRTGKVLVGCDDDTLSAFSTDGSLRFVFRTKQDMDSSPIISDDGKIFVGGENLHALDANGHLLFKVRLGAHVIASPSVRPDNVIAVGSLDHRFYLISPDGTVMSAFETKGPIQGPAATLENNNTVFGSDDAYLYCLAPMGALRWKLLLDGPLRSGVAVNENEDTLYTASMGGTVFAVDAKKGTVRWKTPLGGPVKAAPLLDSQGLLFIGSRDRSLYALDASSGEIVWRISLDAEIDAAPAAAVGNRLVAAADDGAVRILGEKP
jgi:outer membrane protein assembly factor BamB